MGLQPPGLLVELPGEKQCRAHDKRRVVCGKAFDGKVARLDSGIAVYEHDYGPEE